MSDRVLITITDGVADVVFNRADKRNALDNAMFSAIAEAGEQLKSESGVRAVVLSGDAIGLAPLTAIEAELRSGKIALVPFDAPWLHMSYGLFYPRKRSLSRAAQLFVTQLRQVETALQVREQRAVSRTNLKAKGKSKAKARAKGKGRRPTARTRRKVAQTAKRRAPVRRED